MSELMLRWLEAGQFKTQVIYDRQSSKSPGTIRLGRDPARCDVVFQDRSVSGLHVEIFFQPQQQQFFLRNLRQTNPPIIDGQPLSTGEVPLRRGSTIRLGKVEAVVDAIRSNGPGSPPTSAPPPGRVYGLQCPNPKCGKVSPYDHHHLQTGCPWCGFSLAAAESVLEISQERLNR